MHFLPHSRQLLSLFVNYRSLQITQVQALSRVREPLGFGMPRLEAEERIKMLLAALRSTNASLDLNTIGELTGTKPSTV